MTRDRKLPLPPPKWLQQWLSLPFYKKDECMCKIHVNKYSTIYCGVCMGEPVCDICWKEKSKEHENHDQILKVRIASGRAAIELGDMKKLWDVSYIQDYRINGKSILHLKPKLIDQAATTSTTGESDSKSKHEDGHVCATCKMKSLKLSTTFCSIECKHKNGVSTKMGNQPNTPPNAEGKKAKVDGESKKRKSMMQAEISGDNHKSNMMKTEIISRDPTSLEATKIMRKRSRKGIPRRAPLKSY